MDEQVDNMEELVQPELNKKIRVNWRRAGKRVVETALQLFFSFQDSETPRWAKGVILGALAYFITPLDTVPDFVPVLGFSDDLGVMLSAIAVVAIHIKDEHRKRAKDMAERIFKV